MSVRALIKRPQRKMHLAVLDAEHGTWVTYCDLHVSADEHTVAWEYDAVGGPTTRLVRELRALIRPRSGQLCAHCRRFVLLIELLHADRDDWDVAA